MFNIAEFNSKVNKYGVLKTSGVAVTLTPPRGIVLQLGFNMADIPFMAEATNIPGVSLATTEIRRHGYGVIEKKPYVPIFTDIEIVFRADKRAELYKFFQQWMRMIINFDGRNSINSDTGIISGQKLYEVAYKDFYMSTLAVHVLNNQGEEPLTVVMTEAYPIFLGPVGMAWGSVNDYVKFTVKFTFRDWYIQGSQKSKPVIKPTDKQTFGQPLNN